MMRRNTFAAVLQVAAMVLIVAGAFALVWQAGVIAVGVVLLLVGLDVEDDG